MFDLTKWPNETSSTLLIHHVGNLIEKDPPLFSWSFSQLIIITKIAHFIRISLSTFSSSSYVLNIYMYSST